MSLLPRRLVTRVDAWAGRLVENSSARVSASVEQTVRTEMTELARMLRQQGDAADELAETFGRTLLRLSETVDELRSRLDRLERPEGVERLDAPAGDR